MTNLILAIICSSGNALIMKFAECKTNNRVSLLLVNYVVAIVFGIVLVVQNYESFKQHDIGVLPILSLINGILFVLTFLLLQLNVYRNGATISASLSHMGLMIPVVMSIFLFGEFPNIKQSVGLALAIGALVFISLPTKEEKNAVSCFKKTHCRWLLIPMLISGGMADTMSKIFEEYCDHSLEDLFLSSTFLVALFICIIVFFYKKEKVNIYDLIYGVLLGLSNYLSTKFLIRSIYSIPAYIAYISYGLGVVIFVNIVNILIMHESLNKRDYVGMLLAMTAIALLNLI